MTTKQKFHGPLLGVSVILATSCHPQSLSATKATVTKQSFLFSAITNDPFTQSTDFRSDGVTLATWGSASFSMKDQLAGVPAILKSASDTIAAASAAQDFSSPWVAMQAAANLKASLADPAFAEQMRLAFGQYLDLRDLATQTAALPSDPYSAPLVAQIQQVLDGQTVYLEDLNFGQAFVVNNYLPASKIAFQQASKPLSYHVDNLRVDYTGLEGLSTTYRPKTYAVQLSYARFLLLSLRLVHQFGVIKSLPSEQAEKIIAQDLASFQVLNLATKLNSNFPYNLIDLESNLSGTAAQIQTMLNVQDAPNLPVAVNVVEIIGSTNTFRQYVLESRSDWAGGWSEIGYREGPLPDSTADTAEATRAFTVTMPQDFYATSGYGNKIWAYDETNVALFKTATIVAVRFINALQDLNDPRAQKIIDYLTLMLRKPLGSPLARSLQDKTVLDAANPDLAQNQNDAIANQNSVDIDGAVYNPGQSATDDPAVDQLLSQLTVAGSSSDSSNQGDIARAPTVATPSTTTGDSSTKSGSGTASSQGLTTEESTSSDGK